jgi:hypothetical protein
MRYFTETRPKLLPWRPFTGDLFAGSKAPFEGF